MSNNIKIKLCGLSREADIQAANSLMPEYIGYIFAPGRKRTISAADAKRLNQLLNENIISVGVFKDNPIEEIVNIAKSGTIKMVQLHGKEDDSFIKAVKDETGLSVIKAVGVAWEEDIETVNNSAADYVLLDTPGGGTGFSFDHDLIKDVHRDYFLAGGLSPANVSEIIEYISEKGFRMPYALDVSSGIETEGVKDSKKMEAFVKVIRNYC